MDKTQAVLSQYELTPIRMKRGRGVLLLETQDAIYQLKEYLGPKDRTQIQKELTTKLSMEHSWKVEQMIPNKEGNLYSSDPDKKLFVLLTVIDGKECNVKEIDDCVFAMEKLRELHENMYLTIPRNGTVYHFAEEVNKHRRDLVRGRKFIRNRRHLTEFELKLLQLFDHYWKQADFVGELSCDEKILSFENVEASKGSICHGDCQYHNILIDHGNIGFTSFEKWNFDVHIRDFYRLFRKIMEKNRWNISIGRQLIEAYCRKVPFNDAEKRLFFLRLCFPEKFWKIMNFYLNARKSYISERNIEKYRALIDLEAERVAFLENLIVDIYSEGEYNSNIRYFK